MSSALDDGQYGPLEQIHDLSPFDEKPRGIQQSEAKNEREKPASPPVEEDENVMYQVFNLNDNQGGSD